LWSEIELQILDEYRQALDAPDLLDWIETSADELSLLGRGKYGIMMNTHVLLARNIYDITVGSRFAGVARLSKLTTGGYRIDVNRMVAGLSTSDYRFWIAHELAHTYLVQHDTLESLSRTRSRTGTSSVDEWLCNRFAAAILVPRWLTKRSQNAFEPGRLLSELFRLESLATKLDVPERMLARRVFHELNEVSHVVLKLGERKQIEIKNDDDVLILETPDDVRPLDYSHGFHCKWAALPASFDRDDRRRIERAVFPRGIIPNLDHGQSAGGLDDEILRRWLSVKIGLDQSTQISSFWTRYGSAIYGRISLHARN